VADSDEAYVAQALRLGRDAQYRAGMRALLAERGALLFDQEAPVRALESFLLSSFPE
jgi:predicted O-linked N-acetylglucosamine transferase (SPINDLY family)